MESVSDVRVRRPQSFEALMVELRDEGGFATFRDVLLFAAAVGQYLRRRVSFASAAGDPIRYETLTAPPFAEAFVNMIAVREEPADAEIMDRERLDERVRIFEEYACGGLEYIQEQVNVRHQPASDVVLSVVAEAVAGLSASHSASVDELIRGVRWT